MRSAGGAQFLRIAAAECEYARRFVFHDDAERLVRSANIYGEGGSFSPAEAAEMAVRSRAKRE